MRARKLIAAAFLVMLGTLTLGVTASAVHAQDTPSSEPEAKFRTEAEEKCYEDHLAKGGTIDDCQKAPSPILPEKNEIIWGAISFVILFFLLAKFAWPGIKKGMDGRTERIRADLEAAEEAKADATNVLDDYRAQLADAKNESARIIEEARQQADALKKDQEQRLQTELAEMRARAAADVESAKTQAIADLRNEVANLAIGAAEIVVQRNLDRVTQSQLVENYINQVASRAN